VSDDWKPTTRLRFVERGADLIGGASVHGAPTSTVVPRKILQQWFAPDMPAYMQSGEGEWRDVEVATK
jgi:hypothetical protein